VKNEWHLKNVSSNGNENRISFSNLEMSGSGLSYKDSKGKHFEIDKGKVHMEAENISFSRNRIIHGIGQAK